MKKSLGKILSILVCLALFLMMVGCGNAFKDTGSVSVDVGTIVAAAIKASREADTIVSEKETDIISEEAETEEKAEEKEETVVDDEESDDEEEDEDDEMYAALDDSLVLQAKVKVSLMGEGFAEKTKDNTFLISLDRFDDLEENEAALSSGDDMASVLGIKDSYMTFKDVPIGSVVKAYVELETSITVNNRDALKAELKEYMKEELSAEESDEKLEKFIDAYIEKISKGELSFGRLKGSGSSEPKEITDKKETITVELTLEEVEPEEPEVKTKTVTIAFLFNDGKNNYVSNTEYPSIKYSEENSKEFFESYVSIFAKIAKAGYELNQEKTNWFTGKEPTAADLIKLLGDNVTVYLYFDKAQIEEPTEFEIKFGMDLTKLPGEKDGKGISHAAIMFVDNSKFASIKADIEKKNMTSFADYFKDTNDYCGIFEDQRVNTSDQWFTVTAQDDGTSLLSITNLYYYVSPQKNTFKKGIGDTVGVIALVYCGDIDTHSQYSYSLKHYDSAYIGYAGSITLAKELTIQPLEMKQLDSIPAKVFIKLGDEYAYNYDNIQDAYMNGYIGFDYAIPACHYDVLNANEDFKKEILKHEVLKPYVEQGYVLDTIDFDRMETGMPVIVLNLVESAEEPEEKDEIVTVQFVFKNEKGEYAADSKFVTLSFNMNNLDASSQLLNSQIAKAQENEYELSSEKHTWYSKDKTLYWNVIFEQAVGKTYKLYFDKVVQEEPEPEEPEPNPTVSVGVDIDLPAETLTIQQTLSEGSIILTATDSSNLEYTQYKWSIDGLSYEGEGNTLTLSPLDLRWNPGEIYNVKLMAKDKDGIWHACVIQIEVTQQMLIIG